MIKVSVIVPVYNVEKYLRQCLDSIINQTLEDIEIICINDGSTDDSLSILEEYAKIDNRIQVFNQENKGLGATRNRGIDLANGKYISFVDSDDFLELNAILELYNLCEEKKLDFTIFKVKNYDEVKDEYFNSEYYDLPILGQTVKDNVFNYDDVSEILQKINVVAWNKLFNLEFIRRINARFSENLIFEDNVFFWRALFNAERIYFYQKYLYNYRRRDSSITSAGKKNLMDTIEIHNQIINVFKEHGLFEAHKNFLFNKKVFLIYARFEQIHDDYKETFFRKMKADWIETVEEYGSDVVFNLIDANARRILNSILESSNHVELELKNQFLNILVDINNFSQNNEYLIEKKQFRDFIDNLQFPTEYTNNEFQKKIYSFYINSYKQAYIIWMNTRFNSMSLRNLNVFTEKIINSTICLQDKIDILAYGKVLYQLFLKFKSADDSKFLQTIRYIVGNDFINALNLNGHDLYAEKTQIMNSNIFLVFVGLDMQSHGLLKACFNKANLFNDNGYRVKLLNIDSIKNFDRIKNIHYNLGNLSPSIEIVNIFEHYSRKNTLNGESKKSAFESNSNYKTEKIENDDGSILLKYYNENALVSEEVYISGSLALERIFDNNRLKTESYYTPDGFNYFYRDHFNNDLILFDRFNDNYISFNNQQDFEDYFICEMCLDSNEKPFLINDCSGPKPNIKNVNKDVAYKIGIVNNNPYFAPYTLGSKRWNLSSLEEYASEDAVVFLSQSSKNDFVKEFGADNFVVIPNFIKNDEIKKSKTQENTQDNIISIFARISPDKNISDLIRAFKKVSSVHKDAILKIYGRVFIPSEIQEKKVLDSLVDELDLSDSVKFMGHSDNVFEDMSESLATVLCSVREGFGLVIIESMINSTPVVSYDTNYGPKDIIVDEVNGYIVEKDDVDALANRIIELLDNPEKAREMGILSKQHILDNFTEEIILKKWENLFNCLMKNQI